MNRDSSLDQSSSTAATRAREILGSLKERREFFESRIASHGHVEKDCHQQQHQYARNKASLLDPTTGTSSFPSATTEEQIFKPLPIRGAPLFTAQEKEAITRQLGWSLQERKSRLSRVSGKTPDNLDKFLAHQSSATQIRTPQQQQQYLGFRSPSNHSAHTAETVASTASPNSSPGNFSISEQNRLNSSDDMFSSIPRPPTLDEIKESFQEIKSKEESASSRTSSCAEDIHHTNVDRSGFDRSCQEEEEGKDACRGTYQDISAPDDESEEKKDDVGSSLSAQRDGFVSGSQRTPVSDRRYDTPETTPGKLFHKKQREEDDKHELSAHQRARSFSSIPTLWTGTDNNDNPIVKGPSSNSSTIFRQSQPLQPPVNDTVLTLKSSLKDISRHQQSFLTDLLSRDDDSVTRGELSSARHNGDLMRMHSTSMGNRDADRGEPCSTDSSGQKSNETNVVISENHPEDNKFNQYGQSQQIDDQEPKQLFSISLDNEDDRRMLLKILRKENKTSNNLEKNRHIQLVPLSASPLTVEEDTVIISDESSFECSIDDTDTSGWDSGEDDVEELDDASDIDVVVEKKQLKALPVTAPPAPPMNQKSTGESTLAQASIKVYRTTGPISLLAGPLNDMTIDEASVEGEKDDVNRDPAPEDGAAKSLNPKDEITRSPVLFVSEEVADELSGTNGGLYTLALLSGLTENVAALEMRVIALPNGQRGYLCLSPDFRCGAHGSLYDIAVRSGCEIEMSSQKREEEVEHLDPLQRNSATLQRWPRKRKKFPARSIGGLYYIAFKSGLTREAMQSKQGYTVSMRRDRSPLSEFDGEIVPTHISNRTCGTTGSLFLALESGMNLSPSMRRAALISKSRGFSER